MIEVYKIGELHTVKYGGRSDDVFRVNGEYLLTMHQSTIIPEPELIEKQVKKSYISHYTVDDGSAKMDREAYESAKKQLLINAEPYADDYECVSYRWANIDDKHAYEKFITTWKPVYAEDISWEKQDFIVYDVTGYSNAPDDIRPIRMVTGKLEVNKQGESLYRYDPIPISNMVSEVASQFGYTHSERKPFNGNEPSTYSLFITRGTLDSIYIEDGRYSADLKPCACVGTFKECIDKRHSYYTIITDVFLKHEKMKELRKQPVDTARVIEMLNHVKSCVSDMDVKVRSKVSKNTVIHWINKHVKELENSVE